MNHSTLVRRMSEAGAPMEAIAIALEALETLAAEAEARLAERRAKDAERQRRHRLSRDVTVTSQDPLPSPSPSHSPIPTPLQLSKERPPKGGPKKGFKFQLSEDVQPTEKDRAVAEREGMSGATFRLEWQKWRSHHLSEAKPVANLHQSWVKWVSNWVSYGRRQADQPARAGPRSSTNGVVEMLNELNGVGNGKPDYERPAKDITPAQPSESGGCESPARLFESPRKSSGGEVLDFRSEGSDIRGSAAAYGAAWRTG